MNTAHESNRILCCDAVEGLRALPAASVPLTVTSPPYDRLRIFGGHKWDFETFKHVADQLWRVTMAGGVVVWVVADAIVGGTETCTSARQKLYFREKGFHVHHTMIMDRAGSRWPSKVRYGDSVEYAFILSKGKPRTINLLRDKPNKNAGMMQPFNRRELDGRQRPAGTAQAVREWGVRSAVWRYAAGGFSTTKDGIAFEHSALMPEQMAQDHILSWSDPGDLVLDPMCGAATTCKLALLNHRDYLGIEVHQPYHRLAERRMDDAHAEYRRRLDDWLSGDATPPVNFIRPPGGFEIIYADPPWPYKPWSRSTGKHALDHYPTMSMADIMGLPVGDLAARDSVLLLWATGPFLDEAVRTIEAWGFAYKTVAFNWVKTRGGTLHTGMGYHTRSNAEFCLLATRGKGLPRVRTDEHQVVVSEVGKHSEKPEAVRQRIESLYGPRRRVEMFARSEVPGWDAMGDAIDGRDIREAMGTRRGEPRVSPLQLVS